MTRHRLVGVATAFLAAAALTVPSLTMSSSDARPASPANARAAALPFTAVTIGADNMVDIPATIRPGLRTIKVTSHAPQVAEASFVHLKSGYTTQMLVDDANAAFGTNDLEALNRFYDSSVFVGGIVVRPGKTGVGRISFAAGKYYAFNPQINGPFTTEMFTPFTVKGVRSTATASPTAKIVAEHDDFWSRTPASIPSSGWLKFVNNAESPHFIELAKLAKGKTYADFKAWVKAVKSGKNVPPPFGSFALDQGLVSMKHAYQFKYDIPKGDYVVLCFMPDREMGMPHAFMGMHRPLTVR